jgi:hypothetical protein
MENDFHLLVVGSRSFGNYEFLSSVLDGVLNSIKYSHQIEIISGGARGADSLAERCAREHSYSFKIFKPDWSLGKGAGFIRNDKMHKYIAQFSARGVVVFWDGESKGSYHNVELAKKYYNPLILYNCKTCKYESYKNSMDK